ncbi:MULTISPECIES: hypothetical protein [Rhizobium/Agrobacterium group]|jgi:hypothetical protein|uniref:hypothetical protein n=1 Tax=Rhizobium/Agrobacterium group TaxID=227290 RepID=UPI0012E3DDA8|nr:hypothetical protein [Rhizobium sp. Root483D2]
MAKHDLSHHFQRKISTFALCALHRSYRNGRWRKSGRTSSAGVAPPEFTMVDALVHDHGTYMHN